FETGTITFTLTGPGGSSYTQTDTVTGNGNYTASHMLLGPLAGTYTWSAQYSGDVNNNSDSDKGGTAEQTFVSAAIVKNLLAGGSVPGQEPRIDVYDAVSGNVIASFDAFAPSFLGGVTVAVGDVNRDGVPDVIVAAGPGGGPHVKAIDGKKLD